MRKIHLYLLSVLSGILLSLPWAFSWGWPVIFFAFLSLFFVFRSLRSETYSSFSFVLPFLSFFVWNLLTTWWIAYFSLFGMFFIVAANASLMALIWWMANNIRRNLGTVSGYFSLLVFWISYEYISHRGILPWPWLTLGNGLSNAIQIIQWYEFTGVCGGSTWILIVNILLFETIRKVIRLESLRLIFTTLVVVLSIPIIISVMIFINYTETGQVRQGLIIQPNIDPYTEKFNRISQKEQGQRIEKLIEHSISNSVDIVVAPETSLPNVLEDSLFRTEFIFDKILQSNPNANIIAGAITKKAIFTNENCATVNSFNSAILYNNLQPAQVSHKTILVAGVEKVPLKEYLNFLPDILVNAKDTVGELTPGKGSTLLKMKSGEFIGPIICFESVFGDFVRQLALKGATYLVVLTNDGWWKNSAGVRQHFEYSRIRAFETRRSVIRSANTGISGFINQRGEILLNSQVASTCALTGKISMNNRLTFYVIYGDYLGKYSFLASILVLFYYLIHSKRLSIKNPH